jgi:hypothetical protein
VLSDMVLWQSSPNANIIPSKCINNPFRTHLVCWKVEQKLLSRHSWHLIQNGMATSFIVGVKTCSDGVTSVFSSFTSGVFSFSGMLLLTYFLQC